MKTKPLFLLIVIVLACFSACEEGRIVDPTVAVTYAVVDSLDVGISITCAFSSAGYHESTISLKSFESYSYTHELMRDIVERGKIPVNTADTLRIVAPNRPVIEFKSRMQHASLWKEKKHGIVTLVVDDRLWTLFEYKPSEEAYSDDRGE